MSEIDYLMDTDTVSNFLDQRRQNPLLRERILTTNPTRLHISIITVEEILRGALDGVRQAQSHKRSPIPAYTLFSELFEALHRFSILPYTEEAEQHYQNLPSEIKRIGTNDCRIAATALAQGYTLVTANVAHYARIPTLSFVDWTRSLV